MMKTNLTRSYFPIPKTSALIKKKRKTKVDDFRYIPSAVPFPLLSSSTPTVMQSNPIQDNTVLQIPIQLVEEDNRSNLAYMDNSDNVSDFSDISSASTIPYVRTESETFWSNLYNNHEEFVESQRITLQNDIDTMVTNLTNEIPFRRDKKMMSESYQMQNNDTSLPSPARTRSQTAAMGNENHLYGPLP